MWRPYTWRGTITLYRSASELLVKSSGKHTSDSDRYEQHRQAVARRDKRRALAGQEIGALPPIQDWTRRGESEDSFRLFCEQYFPQIFNHPWSADHLRVIEKIEGSVQHSERFAVAMPRGSGKSSLCLHAVLWAILTGQHRFVVLLASSADFATSMLENLKSTLQFNEQLVADFPEAIYPIQQLGGESRRCAGQRYHGVRTEIKWTADELVFPTIPGSVSSGAVVMVTGITGNFRGALRITNDGHAIRPTLAIVDDFQTDATAKSPTQCEERVNLIAGAVCGLAGPGERCGVIVPCTVIRRHDGAEILLNDKTHPEFQGERTRLVYTFPSNTELWSTYRTIREDSFRAGNRGRDADQFYRDNREAMDAGARVAWESRHNPDEISAIQSAMHLMFADEQAFWSEYQNEPIASVDAVELGPDEIARKMHGSGRLAVPLEANYLTSFIDVQGSALYYAVVAWSDRFDGYVIDYGTWPGQSRNYYALRDLTNTFAHVYPDRQLEGRIFGALEELTEQLLGGHYTRADGVEMRMDILMVDANWGRSTSVVRQFCRGTNYLVYPAHGRYFGATTNPMSSWKLRPPNRAGDHWRTSIIENYQHVLFDTNYWKSFVHTRLATALGDQGSLSFYQLPGGLTHRMLGDHFSAEYRVSVEARGQSVDEWKLKPNKPDNHFFDCIVGSAVGASAINIQIPGTSHGTT